MTAQEERKLELVAVEVREMYEKAVPLDYVRRPLAWALHQVWKKHDRRDKT